MRGTETVLCAVGDCRRLGVLMSRDAYPVWTGAGFGLEAVVHGRPHTPRRTADAGIRFEEAPVGCSRGRRRSGPRDGLARQGVPAGYVPATAAGRVGA